jgi:hypothetical protein
MTRSSKHPKAVTSHSEKPFLTENAGKIMMVSGLVLVGADYPMAGRIMIAAGVVAWLHANGLLPLPFGL